MIVSLLGFAIFVGIFVVAFFGVKALNDLLPLLRTYVRQKQQALAEGGFDSTPEMEDLKRRVESLEGEQERLKEANAFMQRLIEKGG